VNPRRHDVSGVRVELSFSEYAQRAQEALASGAHIIAIQLPDQDDGPIAALARSGNGTAPLRRAYLDPPTGRVLDASSGRDLLAWLHSFHESLTLREYNGREIVGAVGIAMLLSSLSGIYLWWPVGGLRRSAFGFRRGFVTFLGGLLPSFLVVTGIIMWARERNRQKISVPTPVGVGAEN